MRAISRRRRRRLSAPTNFRAFHGTTLEPEITVRDPVRPERSHYFDIGVDQQITPNFKVGVGFLSQACAQPARRRAVRSRARPQRLQLRPRLQYRRRVQGHLSGRISARLRQRRLGAPARHEEHLEPVPVRAGRVRLYRQHYIYTDHAQVLTASAGANLRIFDKTRVGFDIIYGSGLRAGFANTGHVPAYRAGESRRRRKSFTMPGLTKPRRCASMSSICSTAAT